MVDLYVRLCELGKNFTEVPNEFKEKVKEKLLSHGYIINEMTGIVTKQ